MHFDFGFNEVVPLHAVGYDSWFAFKLGNSLMADRRRAFAWLVLMKIATQNFAITNAC